MDDLTFLKLLLGVFRLVSFDRWFPRVNLSIFSEEAYFCFESKTSYRVFLTSVVFFEIEVRNLKLVILISLYELKAELFCLILRLIYCFMLE